MYLLTRDLADAAPTQVNRPAVSEIAAAAPGIRLGSQVVEGQVIAHVGKMETVAQAMLHLEMFAGTAQGPLTDRENPPFMRRADLQNPTAFLDACQEVTRDAAS